ncbi:hypothetical protein R69919_04264 [Paraburkholderia gardini]|uniref:Uncharacterized protein n=1 Tax=Paraburkholderia gardini TaxID=2823469 RepID=A0ABM8U6R4_9BURK|nr:hypothetical protein R54767_03398 [Paraburkholderia gardini]CAG4915049.1 hypothetical protein R69919_04264 [Paraburkholderia gardini]
MHASHDSGNPVNACDGDNHHGRDIVQNDGNPHAFASLAYSGAQSER